jgi:hypothetical protein
MPLSFSFPFPLTFPLHLSLPFSLRLLPLQNPQLVRLASLLLLERLVVGLLLLKSLKEGNNRAFDFREEQFKVGW